MTNFFLLSCLLATVHSQLSSPSPHSCSSLKFDPSTNGAVTSNRPITPGPLSAPSYTPTWPSLDARPLPPWYDAAKVGIFLHWGVFSVPSFGNEWFWFWWATQPKSDVSSYMVANYPPKFTYQDFARDFTAELYNPDKWATLFRRAGAKYVVLTSKHHEGFTLWPSKYSFGWNAGDVGPKRDVLGDLAVAIRNQTGIRFGLYHSWFEFFNPMYLADRGNNWTTSTFVRNKALPELKELVNKYKPEVIWSDGDWEAPDEYWRSKEFLAWLYNSSPVRDTVVVNDRWGKGTPCTHGGYFTCQDHYNPGHTLPYKWENALTVDKSSWGYRRNAAVEDYHTPQELISELVTTISCGGNYLLNVGPSRDGTIDPILEERLLQLGAWLEVNGDAIYDSVPWERAQNDSVSDGVWYTAKPEVDKLYAILLEDKWPANGSLVLGSVSPALMRIKGVEILGVVDGKGKEVDWETCDGKRCKVGGVVVSLPSIPPNTRNRWGWTLVIRH